MRSGTDIILPMISHLKSSDSFSFMWWKIACKAPGKAPVSKCDWGISVCNCLRKKS